MKKILPLSLIVIVTGCSSNINYNKDAGLATTSNTERNFVIDYGDGKPGTLIQRCLEAPGPATALNDLTVNTEISGKSIDAAEGKIKLDVTNTESLAKLYEVSSILQYAHAMTYRLCEAGLNRHLDGDKYMKHFDKIIESTESLLAKQLEISKEETKQQQEKTKQLTMAEAPKKAK